MAAKQRKKKQAYETPFMLRRRWLQERSDEPPEWLTFLPPDMDTGRPYLGYESGDQAAWEFSSTKDLRHLKAAAYIEWDELRRAGIEGLAGVRGQEYLFHTDRLEPGRYEVKDGKLVRVGDAGLLKGYHGTSAPAGEIRDSFKPSRGHPYSINRPAIGVTKAVYVTPKYEDAAVYAGAVKFFWYNKDKIEKEFDAFAAQHDPRMKGAEGLRPGEWYAFDDAARVEFVPGGVTAGDIAERDSVEAQIYGVEVQPRVVVDLGDCQDDAIAREAIERGADVLECPDFWEQPEIIVLDPSLIAVKEATIPTVRKSRWVYPYGDLREDDDYSLGPMNAYRIVKGKRITYRLSDEYRSKLLRDRVAAAAADLESMPFMEKAKGILDAAGWSAESPANNKELAAIVKKVAAISKTPNRRAHVANVKHFLSDEEQGKARDWVNLIRRAEDTATLDARLLDWIDENVSKPGSSPLGWLLLKPAADARRAELTAPKGKPAPKPKSKRVEMPPEYEVAGGVHLSLSADKPKPRRGKKPKPAADMLESELAQEVKAAKVKPPRRRK